MINWNDPDYVAAGHFSVLVKSISITCNDPVKPTPGATSYVYDNSSPTPEIGYSNKPTTL